jgi:hypothetical protein
MVEFDLGFDRFCVIFVLFVVIIVRGHVGNALNCFRVVLDCFFVTKFG